MAGASKNPPTLSTQPGNVQPPNVQPPSSTCLVLECSLLFDFALCAFARPLKFKLRLKLKSRVSKAFAIIPCRPSWCAFYSFFVFLIWKSLVSAQFADIKVELPMWNGEMWKFTESAPPFVIVQLGLQSRPPRTTRKKMGIKTANKGPF